MIKRMMPKTITINPSIILTILGAIILVVSVGMEVTVYTTFWLIGIGIGTFIMLSGATMGIIANELHRKKQEKTDQK